MTAGTVRASRLPPAMFLHRSRCQFLSQLSYELRKSRGMLLRLTWRTMADKKNVLVIGLDPALIAFSQPGYPPGMDA